MLSRESVLRAHVSCCRERSLKEEQSNTFNLLPDDFVYDAGERS